MALLVGECDIRLGYWNGHRKIRHLRQSVTNT